MFCRNCGRKANEGATFCGSCGTRLGQGSLVYLARLPSAVLGWVIGGIFLVVMLGLSLGVGLTVGGEPDERLVGVWFDQDEGLLLEFREDGTAVIEDEREKSEVRFGTSGDVLTLTGEDDEEDLKYRYLLEEDELKAELSLTDEDDKPYSTLTRHAYLSEHMSSGGDGEEAKAKAAAALGDALKVFEDDLDSLMESLIGAYTGTPEMDEVYADMESHWQDVVAACGDVDGASRVRALQIWDGFAADMEDLPEDPTFFDLASGVVDSLMELSDYMDELFELSDTEGDGWDPYLEGDESRRG